MSKFFSEDLVAFKSDPDLIGVVFQTWSDVDKDTLPSGGPCYVHKSLPAKVKDAWQLGERLLPGYVIVQFWDEYDGYCLVSEKSLRLLDRSLAAGDVVKKHPSDAQSGTVTSTSIMCQLIPTCSVEAFHTKDLVPAQGHLPSHGPHAPGNKAQHNRLHHGFPNTPPNRSLPPTRGRHDSQSPLIAVSAQELAHWNEYREEDIIIYKDWIGQVRSINNEVAVRLINGSVVVVEDPDELEEPIWIPGTMSYELMQRLDRAGYYMGGGYLRIPGKPEARLAEPCFPGQRVRTKKGNLRRGSWKFGAYDPSISPEGTVVDVRCIQLEIRWMYPKQTLSLRDQASPPSELLDLDDLGSGGVKVYNRSTLPVNQSAQQLASSCYGPDFGFGHIVRFKDSALAAVNYSGPSVDPGNPGNVSVANTNSPSTEAPGFNRIPRASTQGFDMNIMFITSTSTKVMVRWQDNSTTEEDSVLLHPYLNPDEDDVWPADRVSLKAQEENLAGDSAGSVRAHRVGVVQSVDASARIAQVRWFKESKIDMDTERAWQIHGSIFGEMGDESSNLSLYDIAAHRALNANYGDLAVILPATVRNRSSSTSGIRSVLNYVTHFTSRPTNEDSPSCGVDWFGEVSEICLDGQNMIRLGAASEAHDVKLPPERILVIDSDDMESTSGASEDDEDDEDDEENEDDEMDDEFDEEDWSDKMSVDGSTTYRDYTRRNPYLNSATKTSYEYEGGTKLTSDNDDEDQNWSTDEEGTADPSGTPTVNSQENRIQAEADQPDTDAIETQTSRVDDRTISYSKYPTMPTKFAVLDTPPPTDHHYSNKSRPLTADLMRRIMKETEIMRNSLPDGVFVRSWDGRLDLLRVLIVGPYDTPYEFAPFVIDLHYGASFPTTSPDAYFHSWTNNMGRINPNLYEDGKICLSLLGTWDGDHRNEEWSSKKSTILQVIVSLMGLVLVKEPYYNEAGYDVLIGSAESQVPSALYSEKVYVTSKAFIKTALANPPQGLGGIIAWLYLNSPPNGPGLLRRVIEDSVRMLPESSIYASEIVNQEELSQISALRKLSAGAAILLERNLAPLVDYLKIGEPALKFIMFEMEHA